MKKRINFIMFVIVFFLAFPAICPAQAPTRIGGFVLGSHISEYQDRIRSETEMGIRHMECLREVEIKKIQGFKSGMVYYGTCTGKKPLIRIKLKYEDSSAEFYEQLLKRYKKRFGEPDEWKGDPFHVVVAWKWSFTDKDNNRISMILQHNMQDEEEKMGNSVKLTMSSLMEAEHECYKNKEKDSGESAAGNNGKQRGKAEWDQLIPQ